MIYAVEILDKKFVKIGFTQHADVRKRISELQTGCPFEIKPIFTVEGTIRQERALHASLTAACARTRIAIPPNEWYPGKSFFFRQFLDALRYGADMGLHYTESFNPALTGLPMQAQEKRSKKSKFVRQAHEFEPNIKWPVGG